MVVNQMKYFGKLTLVTIFLIKLLFMNSIYANNPEKVSENKVKHVIDFTRKDFIRNWNSTTDRVMGGLSNGNVTYKEGVPYFSGDISLANNGGFSLINTHIEQIPSALNTIVIDVQGDGLVYQLRLAMLVDGYRLAYKYDFKTTANRRQKISFLLQDFQAVFRGRVIENAPLLESHKIQEIGFLIGAKQEGAFALSLFNAEFQ